MPFGCVRPVSLSWSMTWLLSWLGLVFAWSETPTSGYVTNDPVSYHTYVPPTIFRWQMVKTYNVEHRSLKSFQQFCTEFSQIVTILVQVISTVHTVLVKLSTYARCSPIAVANWHVGRCRRYHAPLLCKAPKPPAVHCYVLCMYRIKLSHRQAERGRKEAGRNPMSDLTRPLTHDK